MPECSATSVPASGSVPIRTRQITGLANRQYIGIAFDPTAKRLFVSSITGRSVDIIDNADEINGAVPAIGAATGHRQITNIPDSTLYTMAYDASHDRLFIAGLATTTIHVIDSASSASGSVTGLGYRQIGGANTSLVRAVGVTHTVVAGREFIVVTNDQATPILAYDGPFGAGVNGNPFPSQVILFPGRLDSCALVDPVYDELYLSSDDGVRVYKDASKLSGTITAAPVRFVSGTRYAYSLWLDLTRN